MGDLSSSDVYLCINTSQLLSKRAEKALKTHIIGECLAILGSGGLYRGPYAPLPARVNMDDKDYIVEQCLSHIYALGGLCYYDDSSVLWQTTRDAPGGPWPHQWRHLP
eukprot:7709869-Karenia_brevis.AAC.1